MQPVSIAPTSLALGQKGHPPRQRIIALSSRERTSAPCRIMPRAVSVDAIQTSAHEAVDRLAGNATSPAEITMGVTIARALQCSARYATILLSVPIRSISTSIRSPGRMNTGGVRAYPTTDGVPVAIISPGSSVIVSDKIDQRGCVEDHVAGVAILHHRAIKPCDNSQPSSARDSSSGVANSGPKALALSKFLPIVHWVDLR